MRDSASGRWFLPGGGVRHGEHPEDALARELREETGLAVSAPRLLAVLSDVTELMPAAVSLHTVRLVYDASLSDGELRPETDGSSDQARWVTHEEALALPLQPFVANVLSR